jgi:hypothetical protein
MMPEKSTPLKYDQISCDKSKERQFHDEALKASWNSRLLVLLSLQEKAFQHQQQLTVNAGVIVDIL